MTRSPRAPGDVLLHPIALAALVVWAINDHVLKHACPGLVTGKLSDVASLAFFPLLPIAAREMVLARTGRVVMPSRAWAMTWIALTGAVMATINTLEVAANAYRVGLGIAQCPFRAVIAGALVPLRPVALWMDPSDLLTLPALAIPIALSWSRGSIDQRRAETNGVGPSRAHVASLAGGAKR